MEGSWEHEMPHDCEPNQEQAKQIAELVNRPWRIEIYTDESSPEFVLGCIEELDLCSFGSNRGEAYQAIENALGLLMRVHVMHGMAHEIPAANAKTHARTSTL